MVNILITVINIIHAIFTFWAKEGFVTLAQRTEEAALRPMDIFTYTHKTRVCACVCVCVGVTTGMVAGHLLKPQSETLRARLYFHFWTILGH